MKLGIGIKGEAEPRGLGVYRHWLLRVWDSNLPVALVIGINPNKATEIADDAMTNFLTRMLRNLEAPYRCGGYYLVNCFDYRDRRPESLLGVDQPSSDENDKTILDKLEACDFVVLSWGTTYYGQLYQMRRDELAQMVRRSGKPSICFSPKGAPVYCSQTNANSKDGRWSSKPVIWT